MLKSYVEGHSMENVLTRVKVDVEKLKNVNWYNDERDLIRKALDIRLKELETYDELKEFFKDMNSFGLGVELTGKRRGYNLYHFTHMYSTEGYFQGRNYHAGNPKYLNRVEYLYSDGASTGECYVKNLWRVAKVW